MKKSYFYFAVFISIMLSSQLLSGQSILSDHNFMDNGSRETAVFECPSGNVFCYLPVNSDNAFTSDLSAAATCYQSFSGATGSFSKVTIWALHTSAPSPDRELIVEVYGAGATPGGLINTTTTTVDAVATGDTVIGFAVYTYTIDIPSTSVAEGWVSVAATAGGTPAFFWLNTYATPIYPALQNSSPLPGNQGLALSLSTGPPPIPLSSWAFVVFGLFAATFVFIKFRK